MIYEKGTLIKHRKKGEIIEADGTSDYGKVWVTWSGEAPQEQEAEAPVATAASGNTGIDYDGIAAQIDRIRKTINEITPKVQEISAQRIKETPVNSNPTPTVTRVNNNSAYTFKKTANGKIQIFENGKDISGTGYGFDESYARQLGYSGSTPANTPTNSNAQVSPEINNQNSNQEATPVQTPIVGQGTPAGATPTYNAQEPVVNNATAQMTANQEAGQKASDQAQADLTTQFKDYQKQMADAQEESNAKTEELLKKMGEDSTANMLKQFQDTQASIAEGYKTYFDEQAKYLAEMQNQPSAVEQLQKFREEQGLPQMEKELATADQIILQTETMLSNIESDIRKRTEGLPVSEAAARRLQAMESVPLSKQLSEQLNSRQRVAAGLEAKMNTVKDFMTAAQSDIATKKETSLAKLGFAKEKAEFTGDLATDSMNFYTTIQDNMNKIDTLRLSQVQSDTQYKQALAEAGFSYYQQTQAAKVADIKDRVAFQNELVKIKLETDLKKAFPTYDTKVVEDENGQFITISTDPSTGKSTIQNLGVNAPQGGTSDSGGSGSGSGSATSIFTKAKVAQMASAGLDEDVAATIYSEILKGTTLEEIRDQLRAAGLDISLLDIFDRVNDIRSIVEGSGENKPSGNSSLADDIENLLE